MKYDILDPSGEVAFTFDSLWQAEMFCEQEGLPFDCIRRADK